MPNISNNSLQSGFYGILSGKINGIIYRQFGFTIISLVIVILFNSIELVTITMTINKIDFIVLCFSRRFILACKSKRKYITKCVCVYRLMV